MSRGVQRLLGIGRNTADLDRALAFYCDALGFRVDQIRHDPPLWPRLPERDATPARSAWLTLGEQQIELTEFPGATPYPAGSTACDLWFQHCAIVVRDMHAAYARAMTHGATPITQGGPQTLPPSAGSVAAFKFRDPDGHPLELIHFPPGTGDPAWQRAPTFPGRPTLGIDHSAISVADVERSIAFYERLGFRVVSRGVNHGIAQRRLDDLEHVVVDVIALQPVEACTPHLELLGYRRPRGRAATPVPDNATAADRLVWGAGDIDVLLDAFTDAGSTDSVAASGFFDGVTVALLRDPDGHLIALTDAA